IFREASGSPRDTPPMSVAPARVVVVEDEDAVREAVVRALTADGHVVAAFGDAHAPDAILGGAPDLAVLDVLLPGGDGFARARRRRAPRDTPVVFLPARDGVEARLEGFAIGADDSLVKPFALEELLARVRAVLRRTGRLSEPLLVGDLLVDESTGAAARAG